MSYVDWIIVALVGNLLVAFCVNCYCAWKQKCAEDDEACLPF